MTTQSAAPKTDVGLTEAERSYGLIDPSMQWRGRWYSEASVERIVAERVRVVEGERDAARADAAHADHVTDTLIERAQRIGMSVRAADPSRYAGWTEDQWAADAVQIMDSIDGSCADLVNGHVHALIRKAARAESAEAAHRALQAAVEALADEWAEDYPGPTAACNRTPDEWARDLRALLAGDAR